MKGVIAWIVAAGAGIVPPILAISLWRSIEGDLPFRIVTNTGFDAFQISIVPILAGLGLVTLIVEGLGYTLRGASFGLGAIMLTFLGLKRVLWSYMTSRFRQFWMWARRYCCSAFLLALLYLRGCAASARDYLNKKPA